MSIKTRYERYIKYNLARKASALRFNEYRANFLLKIVPFLLHSNYPDLPGYMDDEHCPYGIHRFTPEKFVNRDLLLRYFSQTTALVEGRQTRFAESPVIHSLKTIGSIGTIGQTEKSDCDYWVSVRIDELGDNGFELLNQKCRLIEEWAATKNIEIHFFLMDIDQTRENSFDSKAEEESAGSALKLLLKDELFRTHILVAGKMLLWWLIPPGLSVSGYKAYVKRISDETSFNLDQFIDLGYISDLPKSEIFGACLWQMNKALDSPFKSVIKFAYLELLLRNTDQALNLFSDRIKLLVTYPDKLLNRAKAEIPIDDIDPYLLLAREIVLFYAKEKTNNKRDEFIRECFYLKTLEGMESEKKRPEKEKQSAEIRTMMESWQLLPANMEFFQNYRKWTHKDRVHVGQRVHDYLIDTYKRLRWIFKTFKEVKLTITEYDISILGRKLFTFYKAKPNKITYIGSLSRESIAQDDITFHVARFEGKDYFYAFQGEQTHVTVKENMDYVIKRETNLIHLIVWLMVNNILAKKTRLHLTKNYLPVELADIQGLAATMISTFPPFHFAHISGQQLLEQEVVTKALAIINFSKDTVKDSKVFKTAIITLNSYGEYFLEEYETLTQYKNALRQLLTQHFVSRWNENLEIYIPPQAELHLIQKMIST